MDAVPNARALELGQDRLVEKELFRRLGIATAAFGSVEEVGAPGAREVAPVRIRRQGPACRRDDGGARRRRAGGSDRPVRPRAVDRRGAWERRLDRVLPAHRERAPRGNPRRLAGSGTGCAAGGCRAARGEAARRPRLRRRARGRAVRRRRRAARERVCPAGPQHRALDDRRRRDEPVREPPPRDPRASARVDHCPG